MMAGPAERHRLAVLGWIATLAMSLAMYGTVVDKSYLLVGGLLSAVLIAVGAALRTLRIPSGLVLLCQVTLFAWLVLIAYGGHTKYGVLPTGGSAQRVQDYLRSGMDAAQQYPAPAPKNVGLTLIIAAFVVAIAILVDFVAAGLDRAPLAGLPLLALYTVPVAILDGVPFLGFLPGAAAYVLLLLYRERSRLTHWGRVVTRGTRTAGSEAAMDTAGLSSTARRVSVTALAAAVILPALIPSLGDGVLYDLTHRGGGGLSFRNPMVSMAHALHRKDPLDLVTVRTSAGTPRYLRLAVLDKPTERGWRNSGVNLKSTVSIARSIPPPSGLSPRVRRSAAQMDLRLGTAFPADSGWLPVPDGLSRARVRTSGGDATNWWGYVPRDQTVVALQEGAEQAVQSYEVQYQEPKPTRAQLADALPPPGRIEQQYARVPDGVPDVVKNTAQRVTAGATSDFAAAVRLQDWLRSGGNFTYSLNVNYDDGYQAMSAFLDQRRGYCQQFAATYAMMARTLGIPARVVVGFLSPAKHSGDTYTFTSHNAHSWPELYFSGVGWVRFEPTPGNGAVVPPYAKQKHQDQGTAVKDPIQPLPQHAQRQQTQPDLGKLQPPPTTGATPSDGPGLPSPWWLLLLLVPLVIVLPGLVRQSIGRSRLRTTGDSARAAEAAWVELRDRIRDLGLAWTGSLTPRARARFVEPLLDGDPDATEALDRLALTVERARYARTAAAEATPGSDAQTVLDAIARGVPRSRRVRAWLWPTSLLPDVRRIRFRHGPRPATGQ